MNEEKPVEYISYNGLGRSPMLWGIPYMTGLFVMSFCLMGGMSLGVFVSPVGWLFSLIGVPVLLFVKSQCATDDKAIDILFLEMKWVILKSIGGNAKYFGGCLTITPISYGRKFKYVKRYFKKATV
jgi:type IV secretion system protein VirB3